MTGAPRNAWFGTLAAVGIFGLVIVLTQVAGCRKEPAPPEEDAAERGRKSEMLYSNAVAAAIPEKYDLFRRVIALYGDTPAGKRAFIEVVVTMLHDRPPRLNEALEIARKLRDRHPTDKLVGECFKQVTDAAYGAKDEATRTAALGDWAKWVEAHDIAGDIPKSQLYLDLLNVRIRQERWEDAVVAADTALGEPEVSKPDRVEVLVRKGNLLGDKLGKKDQARAAFQEALELARKNHAPGGVPRGLSPDQVEAEIKRLDGG